MLSILVYSGIVLLPVLLPVAATGRALVSIPPSNSPNNSAQSTQDFSPIERLGVGNVPVSINDFSQVCNLLMVCGSCINKYRMLSITHHRLWHIEMVQKCVIIYGLSGSFWFNLQSTA